MRSVNLLTVENVRLVSCTAESPPQNLSEPPILVRPVLVSTGLLRITATEGREIAYLHLGAFSHPLMPRTRVWRKDDALIFKQPTPGRYWILEVPFGKVDFILSRICALSPKVDAPELEEQQTEPKMSPLVRDAIETCSKRPKSVQSMNSQINANDSATEQNSIDMGRFDDADDIPAPLVTGQNSFLDSDDEPELTGLGITSVPSRSSSRSSTTHRAASIAPRLSSRASFRRVSSVKSDTSSLSQNEVQPLAPLPPTGPYTPARKRSSASSESSRSAQPFDKSIARHSSPGCSQSSLALKNLEATGATGDRLASPLLSSRISSQRSSPRLGSPICDKFTVAPRPAPDSTTTINREGPQTPLARPGAESPPHKNESLRILEAIMVGSHGKSSPSEESWSPLSPTHLAMNPVFIATPPLKFGELYEFEPSQDLDLFKPDSCSEKSITKGDEPLLHGPALQPTHLVKIGAHTPIMTVGAFISWQMIHRFKSE